MKSLDVFVDKDAATPNAGPGWALQLDDSAEFFPQSLYSLASDISDVSGGLTFITPLPFFQRHTLTVAGREHPLYRHWDPEPGTTGEDSL